MKIRKYIKNIWFLLPAMLMAGCSNDALLDAPDVTEEVPDAITLNFNVPAEEIVNLDTRAETPSITSLTVMCFDKDGKGLSTKTYTSGWAAANGGYSMTVGINKLTRSIEVVTNHSIADNANGAPDASKLYSTDKSGSVMWGKSALSDILSHGSSMTLLRLNAKASVTESADNFELRGWGVFGTATQGCVAPSAGHYDYASKSVTDATWRDSEKFNYEYSTGNVSEEIKLFETPAETTNGDFGNMARIVVKGAYKGVMGYYPVAFRTRTGSGNSEEPGKYSYQAIPVLRNHHYKLNVTEVRAYGWASYDEAKVAEPDNRITVEITDENDAITDIIATRDYMLGIGGDITVGYADDVYVYVLTSYSGEPKFSCSESWVKAGEAVLGSPETVSNMTASGNPHGVGKLYHVKLPVVANDKSMDTRTAEVTVRCGELTRTFTLTQEGRDFKRDPKRKVYVVGVTGLENWTEYFNWLDNTCQGVKPEDNRGEVRNQGLHFAAVSLYTPQYYIEREQGDNAVIQSGDFKVQSTVNGGKNYWNVTQNSTSVKMEIGSLKITNADGIEIVYPLYRTGVFHQLKSSHDQYMREDQKVNGWFYYEVVKVKNKYILDRNLGASTNAPYISTYSGFRGNEGAKGAYFKITTQKSSGSDANNSTNIKSQLGVGNFDFPTRDQVANDWGVTVTNASGTTGEASKVATMTTTGSKVAGDVVYLPHGGYYDGLSSKYETHANIWTKTLLSVNQGFSTGSPEYGYWYLYLDVYGTKINFSNMRFCNGSAGAATTSESVYRYMPIRLQWNGN